MQYHVYVDVHAAGCFLWWEECFRLEVISPYERAGNPRRSPVNRCHRLDQKPGGIAVVTSECRNHTAILLVSGIAFQL